MNLETNNFQPELSDSGIEKMNEFLQADKVLQSLNKYCPNSNLMKKGKITTNNECNLCERRDYENCSVYNIGKK